MKKRLRFQLPHVPLKVLRGKEEEKDIQDKYFDTFKAPGTTTEDAEDDTDTDDDSRTSSLSLDDIGEEDSTRYLSGSTGSIDTVIQLDNEIQNHQDKNTQGNPEYDTTGNVNHETAEVKAVAQVHQLSNPNETENEPSSNDDTSPLLTNMH